MNDQRRQQQACASVSENFICYSWWLNAMLAIWKWYNSKWITYFSIEKSSVKKKSQQKTVEKYNLWNRDSQSWNHNNN